MTAAEDLAQHLRTQTAPLIFGAQTLIRGLTIALIARGHVLLEGPPGVGKTLLARCFARLLGGEFQRVQCTPDLLPSDLAGVSVWRPDSGRFEWLPGPLFADVVLVDELNRTGPKTQSALLEAMEERAITADRVRHALPADFLVVATQNPHEFEGTFPLPESQLDRFLLRLRGEHPDAATEAQILRAYDHGETSRETLLQPLQTIPAELLAQARAQAAAVHVADALYDYATALAAASRKHPQIALGLSPRGTLALMRSARATAAIEGAAYLSPDHLKSVALAVIAHRLVPSAEAAIEGQTSEQLAAAILASVPVPRAAVA